MGICIYFFYPSKRLPRCSYEAPLRRREISGVFLSGNKYCPFVLISANVFVSAMKEESNKRIDRE